MLSITDDECSSFLLSFIRSFSLYQNINIHTLKSISSSFNICFKDQDLNFIFNTLFDQKKNKKI